MVGRDLGEEHGQGAPLLRSKDFDYLALVRGPDLAHPCHHGLTCLGEPEFVAAAIVHASLPNDEPLLFELVDEHHDAAWHDTETAGERLLVQAWFDGDETQDPDIARLEGQCRQSVGEALRRVLTDPREKEADALRRISVLGVPAVIDHLGTLLLVEMFCVMNSS